MKTFFAIIGGLAVLIIFLFTFIVMMGPDRAELQSTSEAFIRNDVARIFEGRWSPQQIKAVGSPEWVGGFEKEHWRQIAKMRDALGSIQQTGECTSNMLTKAFKNTETSIKAHFRCNVLFDKGNSIIDYELIYANYKWNLNGINITSDVFL